MSLRVEIPSCNPERSEGSNEANELRATIFSGIAKDPKHKGHKVQHKGLKENSFVFLSEGLRVVK